jgi:biotin transport system ATP-binding protein
MTTSSLLSRLRRPRHPDVAPHASAPESGISFADVEFRRGDRVVLTLPELRLTERRIGLIGDNGSGKSTLLRLANGLLAPSRGRVTVAGLDTAAQRRDIPAAAGFVFQNPDHQLIFPTVGEEVAFGPAERGLAPAVARQQALALLARHGCAGWADRNVSDLSGGQRQLVCILAVLATEPAVLLMDEPFASLDLPTQLALARRIMALPQQIVMATHDLDLLAGFDRVVWLEAGRVRADGRPADLLPAYRAHAVAAAQDAISA